MGSLSAAVALQLPVRLHGIQLGRPTDVLLDLGAWQVLGFVVLCGDESVRFLPYGAANLSQDEIAVPSPLMLLDDVGFYQQRGVSFRSLLGGAVSAGGALRDIRIGERGVVGELEVDVDGERRTIPAAGEAVVPTRASAA